MGEGLFVEEGRLAMAWIQCSRSAPPLVTWQLAVSLIHGEHLVINGAAGVRWS